MKNLTWQNPEQLFVAQELINKVKSKCCGIKDEIKKSYFLCRPTWPNGKGVKQIPSEAWRNLGCLSQRRVFRDFSFTKRICSLWSVSLDFLVLLHQGKRTDLILIFWFFCIKAKERIWSWHFYSLGSSPKNVKSNEKNKKIKTFRG